MKKMVFVINPYSGKMKIKPVLLDILHMFSEAGYETNVCVTLYRSHAQEIAQNAPDDTELIVVSGGDGTLNEVITGLLKSEKKLPVGYIPAGSTNDFASSMGISMDPRIAAKSIIDGKAFDIDIGYFNNERYFSYIASFGVFTAASYNTPQSFKNTFGHLAYVLEGMKDLTKIVPYNVKIETDDAVLEGSYIFGSVTNTTSVGGMIKLSDEMVKLNDGLFEIVLVKNPKTINEMNAIIRGCLMSNFTGEGFEFIKSKKVTMYFENDMDWSLDGEHQRTGDTVCVENIKTAATIIK